MRRYGGSKARRCEVGLSRSARAAAGRARAASCQHRIGPGRVLWRWGRVGIAASLAAGRAWVHNARDEFESEPQKQEGPRCAGHLFDCDCANDAPKSIK